MRNPPARRALQEIQKDRRGWIRHGIAALAISGLGLGAAGAVALRGSAAESQAAAGVTVTRTAGAAGPSTPSSGDIPLDGTVGVAGDKTAQQNAQVPDTTQQGSAAQAAAETRAKALAAAAGRAAPPSARMSKAQRQHNVTGAGAAADGTIPAKAAASLPVAPGKFRIAARFGQVGDWARYHTGLDFAAPIGTPIHATADGVVTNAGLGSASSWAGDYVVIEFSNREQMLFAHMSSVSVRNGQRVTAGQLIGRIGMTGRAFGPHTHVELYPAGVTPGDIYKAVNPAPWFAAHGLHI